VSHRFNEKNDDPQLLCWSIAMKPSHCYSETYVLENQVRVLRLCGGNLIDIYKAIGKDMQDGAPFEEQSCVQRWLKNKRAAIQTEWRHTHGSFPDMTSNWTALHWAVYRGDVQIIRSLVHLSGVDVEVKDKEGKNRLHSYHQQIMLLTIFSFYNGNHSFLSPSSSPLSLLPLSTTLLY
jgi:hypothetical protein